MGVAPLKPGQTSATASARSARLHARMGVAPLKRYRSCRGAHTRGGLHARMGVAPLKHDRKGQPDIDALKSPRPNGRGPIEASSLAGRSRRHRRLHARMGVAPLKQARGSRDCRDGARLHARMGVAPLKLGRVRHLHLKLHGLHARMGVAPLKQGLHPPQRQACRVSTPEWAWPH